MMANELAKVAIANPQYMQKMMSEDSAAGSFDALNQIQNAKNRSATNARGQTTSNTSMPASAIFGGSPEANAALAPYGYTDM